MAGVEQNWTIEDFKVMVEELKKKPQDALTVFKLNEFIHSVPYGTIEDSVIGDAVDDLTGINNAAAIELLDYSVAQSIALQEDKE